MEQEYADFTGFSPETLDFLVNLKKNNSKSWFEQHKEEYNERLLGPFRSLAAELGEFMLTIDPYFEVRPQVTRAISRIYRDTRFSKDKSLFRDRMWLTYKRPVKEWMDLPGFYFELTPGFYRYGMGFYSAKRATMDAFREAMRDDPQAFLKTISFSGDNSLFTLHGDMYKRPLPNDLPEEFQTWYQRRSFYLACNRDIDDALFSPLLVDDLIIGFNMLRPLYRFILNAHPKAAPDSSEM